MDIAYLGTERRSTRGSEGKLSVRPQGHACAHMRQTMRNRSCSVEVGSATAAASLLAKLATWRAMFMMLILFLRAGRGPAADKQGARTALLAEVYNSCRLYK